MVAFRYLITAKLGLDLKGGVHLERRVQTDDALRIETEQEMERLRSELQTRNVPTTSMVVSMGCGSTEPAVTAAERRPSSCC